MVDDEAAVGRFEVGSVEPGRVNDIEGCDEDGSVRR